MHIPTTPRMCTSVFLLCAGIILLPVYKHWVVTRTWLAVDMPISLAPGHVRTGDFYVNVSTVYNMDIDVKGYNDWRYPDCQDYKVLEKHWWLSRNGRVILTWKDYLGGFYSKGTYLGEFDSSSGRYNLDVEILPDATCLQAFHPRLQIFADNEDYVRGGWIYAMVLLACCGLIGISLGFLAVSSVGAVAQPQATQGQSLAIFDTLHTQRESVEQKLLLMGRASAVPTLGYVYAVTWLMLFLVFAPFELAIWYPSLGIPVRVLHPGVILASIDQTTGLLVYVDRNGNLYLNSKRVTPEELPRALQAEFARRADWSVYVDGDSEADFADVVRAMDLIRSANGSVIMLTPKMRAEAQARDK